MDDLEDLKLESLEGIIQDRKSSGQVSIKKLKPSKQESKISEHASTNDFFLPGQAKVFVKTWGCGHNNSDGEYMAGLLAQNGYDVILNSDAANDADVWLLNSCTVKGPSQQTFGNDIEKGIKEGKHVIVSGCVPQGEKHNEVWKNLSIIGVQQIDQVVRVVEETLKGNTVQLFKESREEVIEETDQLDMNGNPISIVKKRKTGGASLDLPKIRRNPYIEIIPVNTGCLNQCTYCKTKHARGDLGSYYPDEVIKRVCAVLDEGVLEIWLTSEDIGAYGRDIGTNIVELVWGIIKAMESHPSSKAMLRIGMTNPPYIMEHLNEMCKILNHPRVYSFLHVPVQAGSTKVLTEMKRQYTIEDFEHVCDTLLENVPHVTLATDIICGFPGETEQDFDETMRILEKYLFSVLHISQFYPRPGTPAALMKRVSTLVVKNRSRRATTFFESYKPYSHLLNTIQKILVTEVSADGRNFVGHNKSFHQILVPKDTRIMGKWIDVSITETSKWSMKGSICLDSLPLVDESTLVSVNRIPKLVRDQKRMVIVTADITEETAHNEQRHDGSVLSYGKQKNITSSMRSWHLKELVGGLALTVFLTSSSIKSSSKLISLSIAGIVLGFSRSLD